MTEPRATLTVQLALPWYVWTALAVALIALGSAALIAADAYAAHGTRPAIVRDTAPVTG